MLNQVVIVGRIIETPTIKELENGKKASTITLAVQRVYKNVDGEYETDFVPVILYNGIAENVLEYCKKGDVVGVKGKIEMTPRIDEEDFQKGQEISIIAEKVTFLSSKKENE